MTLYLWRLMIWLAAKCDAVAMRCERRDARARLAANMRFAEAQAHWSQEKPRG